MSPAVSAPFTHGCEEIIDGFFFRPEVTQKVLRVTWEGDTLVGNQLIEGRMPRQYVLSG
jgi:hypothetical protein